MGTGLWWFVNWLYSSYDLVVNCVIHMVLSPQSWEDIWLCTAYLGTCKGEDGLGPLPMLG
jgi:hypothetical protein